MSETTIKIICHNCGKHLDVTELEPFSKFHCPICNSYLWRPMLFERYQLMELCGIGGMSKVYRAYDPELEQEFAVKITDAAVFDINSEGGRFTFEAALVSKINHPGIVRIYRGGIFENRPFLVMEYMKKGTLESMQKNFMLPPAEKILNWLAVIADGLRVANKMGIVHHDIKPGNIMLSEDGEVKLGDFDLAEIHLEGMPKVTDFASLAYASPERLYDGAENYKGDIFSLGASTYELLTGEYPFGNKGEISELLQKRKELNFESVHLLNSTVSENVSQFISRMMEYNPDKRPEYDEIISVFNNNMPMNINMLETISGKFKSWLKK